MTLEALVDSMPANNLFEIIDQHELARIDLDLRHIALRLKTEWLIYRKHPDGWLRLIDRWEGGRRSIFNHMAEHGIEPSRAAEGQLDTLVERPGFQLDAPEEDLGTADT